MCAEVLARFPECIYCEDNCDKALGGSEGVGCREEAVACMSEFPVLWTGCALACSEEHRMAWLACTES